MTGPRPQVPPPGDARSYWLQEALAHDPGELCPPLDARVAADVCVVGGGFAGLWTALELRRREPSLRIALLEADICGGGASGRNGGFVSASWFYLPLLARVFGDGPAIRYARMVADQVAEIGRWCSDNGVDAWFHHEGMALVEAGEWQEDARDDAVRFAAAHGLGGVLEPIDAEEARRIADSPRFVGGLFDRDCATIQPARLARGLRRVALERGVRIFEGTRVRRVERARPAVVRTDGGAVRAEQVVFATGAWAAGWPEFRRSFVNLVDYVVATEPILDRLERIGWTSHVGIADGREFLYYLRTTEDGRIVIGGGSSGVLFGAKVGRASTHDRRVAGVAAAGLEWLFPQLQGVRFTHAWGGPIDTTVAFAPFYVTLPPGNFHAGLGYSGHGIAATRIGGRILASMALGTEDEWTALPVVGEPVAKLPPEPFRWAGMKAAVWALEAGDRKQSGGGRRGLLRSGLGRTPEIYQRLAVALRRRTR